MTIDRLKALLAEFGSVALGTYLTIFVLVLGGFAIAISAGFRPEGVTSSAGVLGAAYLATQLTKPLRIGATLILTPLVARVLRRGRTPVAEENAVQAKPKEREQAPEVDEESRPAS